MSSDPHHAGVSRTSSTFSVDASFGRRGSGGGGGGGGRRAAVGYAAPRSDAQRLRKWMWNLLSVRSSKYAKRSSYGPSLALEVFLTALIVANVIVAVVFDTDDEADNVGIQAFTIFSFTVFLVEYLCRFWSCVERQRTFLRHTWRGRLKWAIKPLAVLDLLVLVAFAIDISLAQSAEASQGSRAIRVLRLLRVATFLRIERQSKAFKRLRFVLGHKRQELLVSLFAASVLVLLAAVVQFYIEAPHQPDAFGSVLEALWWAVPTMTSLGGQVAPVTPWGKVVGCVLSVMGLALFGLVAGVMGAGFLEVMLAEQEAERRRDRAASMVSMFAGGHAQGGGGGLGLPVGQMRNAAPSGADASAFRAPNTVMTVGDGDGAGRGGRDKDPLDASDSDTEADSDSGVDFPGNTHGMGVPLLGAGTAAMLGGSAVPGSGAGVIARLRATSDGEDVLDEVADMARAAGAAGAACLVCPHCRRDINVVMQAAAVVRARGSTGAEEAGGGPLAGDAGDGLGAAGEGGHTDA